MLHSNGGCLLPTSATRRTASSGRASSMPSLRASAKMASCSSLNDKMARKSGLRCSSLRAVLARHGYCNWQLLVVSLCSAAEQAQPRCCRARRIAAEHVGAPVATDSRAQYRHIVVAMKKITILMETLLLLFLLLLAMFLVQCIQSQTNCQTEVAIPIQLELGAGGAN